MRIEIRPEQAPGVRDDRLRETWTELSIHAGDQCLTEGILVASGQLTSRVHLSALPLTEWLVENWWNLLHEASPNTVPGARDFHPKDAGWLKRHNLVSAQEGFALPDCSIWADEDHIRMAWQPDPVREGQRVRFIGQGRAVLERDKAVEVLGAFVDGILARLRSALEEGRIAMAPDIQDLFSAWEAIRGAGVQESAFCQIVGALGLDPYDPDEVPETLAEEVTRVVAEFPAPLRTALANGSEPTTLGGNARWITRLLRRYGHLEGPSCGEAEFGTVPFRAGYESARRMRLDLVGTQGPIQDLEPLFSRWEGGLTLEESPSEEVDHMGFLGQSLTSGRVLTLARPLSRTATRFALARAAFLVLTRRGDGPPALLTQAATWSQQASRAFAAEFLAPAEALACRIGSRRVTDSQVEELAGEFQVSPVVIHHQLQNFGIAEPVA